MADRVSVSHITDDMVQRGASAVVGTIFRNEFEGSHNKHIDLARAVLSAALAGCTPIALPEPDGRSYAGTPRWDASGRRILAKVDEQGRPFVRMDLKIWLVEEAESVGLSLVAAAREARRLAGGSQVGDQ